MTTVTIRGTEHAAASLAYQHADASGREPVLLAGKNLTITRGELGRLVRSGAAFAHLVVHGGRLMTIPAGRSEP